MKRPYLHQVHSIPDPAQAYPPAVPNFTVHQDSKITQHVAPPPKSNTPNMPAAPQEYWPCHHWLSNHTSTEPGDRCQQQAEPGNEYCAQHGPEHGEH